MTTTMRKARVVALALAAAAGYTAACTDPTVAPRSTVSSANIFTDTASYRAYIAKIYAGLTVTGQTGPYGNGDLQGIDEGFSQYIRLLWQMEELPTDEAALTYGDAGTQELNTQLWGSTNQFLVSMYYRIFFQASLANDFLRQTSDASLASRGVTGTLATNITQYRAEARFLRALSYAHGIDLFGNIPLVDENAPIGSTAPQQSTRAQVYAYVISELTAIRPSLPAPNLSDGTQYGRATQGAVDMLLAKLYLNAAVYAGTADYANAATAAQRVIASGAYKLDPNYRHLFQADNNTSPEMIFAVTQDGVHTQSYGGTQFLIHAAVGGSMDPKAYGIDGGYYGLRIRPEVLALYPGTTLSADKRAAFFYFKGQSPTMASLTDFTQGIAAPKYTNVTSAGVAGSNATFPDTDYPMFRLGEAYLIYAEAVLRGGGGSRAQALSYVNALRDRAYGNTSGEITDAQLTLDFLLAERSRELLWEGDRRTDLVRYGLFSDKGVWTFKGGVQAGTTTPSFRNLYPLPASELTTNPNLKQNPGY